MEGFGFRVEGSGFRVWGSGFRVSGFRVYVLTFKPSWLFLGGQGHRQGHRSLPAPEAAETSKPMARQLSTNCFLLCVRALWTHRGRLGPRV